MEYNIKQGKKELISLLREKQGWYVHYDGDNPFIGDCTL